MTPAATERKSKEEPAAKIKGWETGGRTRKQPAAKRPMPEAATRDSHNRPAHTGTNER